MIAVWRLITVVREARMSERREKADTKARPTL